MSSADGFEPQPGDQRLTTAMLSDSCDAVGLRGQVLERRLDPVTPGLRAIGRAKVLQFAPSLTDDSEDPYRDAIDFIDSLSRGQLIVIATDNSNASAVWGELFSAAAIGAGAVGVVTDGNLRDTDRIAALGFPAFSSSRRPVDYRARLRVVSTDSAVTICGVRVSPGDLIAADDDGVVVIPQAAEAEVLGLAHDRAARESTVLAELLNGQSLRAVWERHKVL